MLVILHCLFVVVQNVEQGLLEQIAYLNEVSTTHAHEGSAYGEEKVRILFKYNAPFVIWVFEMRYLPAVLAFAKGLYRIILSGQEQICLPVCHSPPFQQYYCIRQPMQRNLAAGVS